MSPSVSAWVLMTAATAFAWSRCVVTFSGHEHAGGLLPPARPRRQDRSSRVVVPSATRRRNGSKTTAA